MHMRCNRSSLPGISLRNDSACYHCTLFPHAEMVTFLLMASNGRPSSHISLSNDCACSPFPHAEMAALKLITIDVDRRSSCTQADHNKDVSYTIT